MDYLGLAAAMQKIHGDCDLLGDGDAGLPWNLYVCAAVQQLEQVSTLAVID